MKPYELDRAGVQVFLEDDGKEKPGSLDGHIFIRKHVYGLTREEVLEGMVVEIEKIIGLLRKAENDLIFFENGIDDAEERAEGNFQCLDACVDEKQKLHAENQRLRGHLALALSFAPKGPVPEGLAPMFYHTLNYEDEVRLQSRIDEARQALKPEEKDK